MRLRVRSALKVAAVGLAAATIATTAAASPAQAATYSGGCNTQVKDGFRIGACLSRSGNNLLPDMYITQARTACYWVSIDVRDRVLNLWSRKQFNTCSTGHFTGNTTYVYPRSNLYPPYFTEVTIVATGVSSVVDSPYQS